VDGALNVAPGGKWTLGVERKAAFAAASCPFSEASNVLRELAGLDISSSEVDRIAQEHGRLLDARQRQDEERWLEPLDPSREPPRPQIACEKLVVEADATSVLTVAGEEHKSVYCGTVFGLEARGQSGERPFLAERLYTASAEDMDDFSERLKALAWRAGMRTAQVAFISDGARCLWKWAQENLPADTVFIQDFWHVCEHLAHLAQLIYPDDWEKVFKKWKTWLRQSQVSRVLKALRTLAKEADDAQTCQALAQEVTYLENGQARMDYARYETHGWPIGSGAIEGTCKHLIKSRFGVTGARWRRQNIYKILALRLAIFNNEWDPYWEEIPKAA
jgi:hypothetical protein